MITLPIGRVYFGDFHGQWNEDYTNPALKVAALSYYGYDFSVFQGSGPNMYVQGLASDLHLPLTFFQGRECMYDWAHITTWDLVGEPPPLDASDFRAVLADMRPRCRMMIVAHPFEPFFPHLEGLLEEGLIDAVEIVNGEAQRLDEQAGILGWLRDMQAKGKRPPVVGGMDIHITDGFQRPGVLYGRDFTPQVDFPATDRNRTAVLVEEFTPEAILRAVRAGQSAVEAGGRLLGDADFVAELERAGYWQARRQEQARLDAITLTAPGEFIAGQATELAPDAVGGPAVLRVIDKPGEPMVRKCAAGGKAELTVPHVFDRNLFYLGASVEAADGLVKAFALKVRSPIEIQLVSEPTQGGRACAVLHATNRGASPIQGRVVLQSPLSPACELGTGAIAPQQRVKLPLELPALTDPSAPVEVTARVELPNLVRTTNRKLVFVGVPRMERDDEAFWGSVPEIFIGRQEQVDVFWTHGWRGPEDCSARVQWAWDEHALHLRAIVVDDVLAPSIRAPKQPMFGDSLQIAINPIDREDVPPFGVYDMFITRHLQGDYLLLDRNPRIACESIHRPWEMTMLPASMFRTRALEPLKITRTGATGNSKDTAEGGCATRNSKDTAEGSPQANATTVTRTELRLSLPWHVLVPMQPLAGYRFSMFLILWDNDGAGCKASLQWPRYTELDTQTVWYAVNNNCWAQMTLTE